MSTDIVKQGLELFNDQVKSKQDLSSNKKKNKKVKDGMKLINTNKQGVWKQLRKLHVQYANESKKKNSLKKRKSRLEEYRDNVDKDHTKSNVKLLKQISSIGKVKSVYCKQIIEHGRQLAKDKTKGDEEETETVFTDRDFDKFEDEYDFFQKLQ